LKFIFFLEYLFGALSILVIWGVSMISCIIIGKFNQKFENGKKLLLLSLRSLAIGVLLSDAFMHLVPEVFHQFFIGAGEGGG
jgi:hypothetical protein